jgi:hypothetical protein
VEFPHIPLPRSLPVERLLPMDQQQQIQLIRRVADRLAERRLSGAAQLLLDMITPVGFLASQLAVFSRPLIPYGRWRTYVAAFETEESWALLREMVDPRER